MSCEKYFIHIRQGFNSFIFLFDVIHFYPKLTIKNIRYKYYRRHVFIMEAVQSTAHQTIRFRICTALILRALVLVSNCVLRDMLLTVHFELL
jgi:hypothetical protein